jgi:DNA polymerase-3 subunit delta'
VEALFEDVIGQPRAIAEVRAAAAHPVHAYLFCGPPGTGRMAAARGFAAALLCPDGGCGSCGVCRRVLSGVHPDLVVVERTGASVGVDDARRLIGLAQRRPFEARRQVLVVTDVHLAIRSAPALLKTLEEPPSATVFVLLAEHVPPELVTVASRCVRVDFTPLAEGLIAGELTRRGVATERAQLIAQGCGGDLRRAVLQSEDPDIVARMARWRAVPDELDGSGAVAGNLARGITDALESALAPLKAAQAEELDRLAQHSEALGQRTIPGRREILERHAREQRRWRTDALRGGLGVLARAYRDRLSGALAAPSRSGRGADQVVAAGRAVGLITEAAASLERNPNEALLLEALLVRLGNVGE